MAESPLDVAAQLIHYKALQNGGAHVTGFDFENGSHGLVLGLHIDSEEKMLRVIDLLHELEDFDIPSGAEHLAELQVAHRALGSLGGHGEA